MADVELSTLGPVIKTAYEGEADTNAFTDTEKTKLAGVEELADVTDATNVEAAGAHMSGGTDVPITDGGTGASDASGARTNLGLVIGTDVLGNVVEDTTPQLGGALDVNGQSIVSVGAGNITLEPDTTGDILLNADDVLIEEDLIHVGDTDTKLQFVAAGNEILLVTGGSERLSVDNSGLQLGAANARVTTILDEDNMASDSATALATQQSIKAYVDTSASANNPGVSALEGLTLVDDFAPPHGLTPQTAGSDVTSIVGGGSAADTLFPSGASAGELTVHSTGSIHVQAVNKYISLISDDNRTIPSDFVTISFALYINSVTGYTNAITKNEHGAGFGYQVLVTSAAIEFYVYTSAATTTLALSIPRTDIADLVIGAISYSRSGVARAAYKLAGVHGYLEDGSAPVAADWTTSNAMTAQFSGLFDATPSVDAVYFGAKEFTSSAIATRHQLEALVREMEMRYLSSAKIRAQDLALELAPLGALSEERFLGRAAGAGTGLVTALTPAQAKTALGITLADVSDAAAPAGDAYATTTEAQTGTSAVLVMNPANVRALTATFPYTDGTAAGGNITEITAAHYGKSIDFDQNLTLDNALGASMPTEVVPFVELTNTDTVTHTVTVEAGAGGTGTINGASSITVLAGGTIILAAYSNAGDEPVCRADGDISTAVDFAGREVAGNLLRQGTRSDAGTALSTEDSGGDFVTGGALTIPNVAGWHADLEIGATTHDFTHNSITLDISAEGFAAGEIYSVRVRASNAIRVIGPAGQFTQADFA